MTVMNQARLQENLVIAIARIMTVACSLAEQQAI